MFYRGIQLDVNVKLFKKNGEFNNRIKVGLDKLIDLLHENNHQLIGKYKRENDNVLIDFNCGHKPHLIRPYDYKNGIKCACCSNICSQHAGEKFESLVKENGHLLLTPYENKNKKVTIDFNCGHKPHDLTPKDYQYKNVNCACCSGICNQHSQENFLKLIKENGHELLSEFESTKKKVIIDFNCGHKPHEMSPNNYSAGRRCPSCSESKGEKIIGKWLMSNDIDYKEQFVLGNNRKYDFFLVKEGVLIEVHGKQHYEEVDFFKGRTLKEEQENDKYKKEIAILKGYKYIEVDYREHKPELALERFIEQYNVLFYKK